MKVVWVPNTKVCLANSKVQLVCVRVLRWLHTNLNSKYVLISETCSRPHEYRTYTCLNLLCTTNSKTLLSLRKRPSSGIILEASQVKSPASSSATLKMVSIRDTMKVPSSVNTDDDSSPNWTRDARSIPTPDSPPVLFSSTPLRRNLMDGGGMPRAEHVIVLLSLLLTWNISPSTGVTIAGATEGWRKKW